MPTPLSLPRCLTGSYRYETPRWAGPGGGGSLFSGCSRAIPPLSLAVCSFARLLSRGTWNGNPSTSTSTSGQRHFSPTPTCIINQPSLLFRRPADDTTRAASTAVRASSVWPSCLHSYSARFCHPQHENQAPDSHYSSIYYLRRGSKLGLATSLRIRHLCEYNPGRGSSARTTKLYSYGLLRLAFSSVLRSRLICWLLTLLHSSSRRPGR